MVANQQLTSTLRSNGDVELVLVETRVPEPGADEIVVEMQASPLNPTDMAVLFAFADGSTARRVRRDKRMITLLQAPEGLANVQRKRWDKAMPVGTEGAGRVVLAGASNEAQALQGRLVSIWGGGMYARYRKVRAIDALVLPDDVSAAEGAAAFVNPLTALGMIETMRQEGFTALVHTAAASTLGQILCRLCNQEGIGLVNIVRKSEQVALLRSIGAHHVCNTAEPSFEEDLRAALQATGATLAFDAIGGGRLAGQILAAMEQVASTGEEFQMYGSNVSKKVYIYGGLDMGPLEVFRNCGLAWQIGGWLLFHFLERIGPARALRLKKRVRDNLKFTFAMTYSNMISLEDVCDPQVLRSAARTATGAKYLINLDRNAFPNTPVPRSHRRESNDPAA